ncbi:DNRLRE domain-containing protein [Clostridium felsineum]|uniref:Uncharacterized protein n=1 Tax=Clostridium felsineum TaxID=36839 RepID=A0A1S8L228_9CLOT|nr:DNRLRE domain-containing protein [Clostridium felsineum]URZ05295.1 hypothetical protein CLROS_006190 [Clostridium felsineum]URZ10336.1 hypothetical protein CROST_010440 [Clostridium felsineum]
MRKIKRNISFGLIVFLITAMFHITIYGQTVDISSLIKGQSNQNNQTEKKEKKNVSKITKELEEQRTENTKRYQKEDGSYEIAEYGTAVHYKENNKWKDIDNTLKTSDDSGYLENKQNDFKIKISKESDKKKLVDVKKDKYEFSWNLEDIKEVEGEVASEAPNKIASEVNESVDREIKANKELASEATTEQQKDKAILVNNEKIKTLKNIISGINFKDAFQNTDLQYVLKGSDIKENIILNKYTDNCEYKFNLNIKNMILKLQKDNSIIFYDSTDKAKEIFKINAPVMYDSKGKTSSNIKVSLTQDKDTCVLKLTPDTKWLKSKKRAYPVTIDPSVRTSLDKNSIHDTFVASNDTANKAQNQYLRVGSVPQIGTTRTYIKFDLPQLSSGDMIVSAGLNLEYNPQVSKGSNNQVNVHKVNQDFNPDNLSWGTQPSYDPHVEALSVINSTQQDWIYWDITSIAKQWYTSGNNYGLMLEEDNSSNYTSFWSDNIDDAYSKARPQVSFAYINNSGIENYWTYHTQAIGRAGTSYLNDYNGNLVLKHDDISMSGSRLPIAINHIFNSNDRGDNINYGNGWRLNVSQKIEQQTIEGQPWYKYTDEDGTKHYFLDSGGAELQDELNLGLTLKKNPDGSCSISDKKNNTIKFNSRNNDLEQITDANGNVTVFVSDNVNNKRVLTEVVDPSGRVVKLSYGANGNLASIVDTSGRTTSYSYDGAGNLTGITYPDGKTSSYSYDGNHNLINVTDYDGYKVDYSYYGALPYRVSSIAEGNTDGTAGDKLDISYGNNNTTFTDEKGRNNEYMFDDRGKTLSVKDIDGSAEYYQYGDTTNVSKLTSESKLQKTVENLLTNHELESTDGWGFNSDGGSGTSSFSTENHYLGNQSIKIDKTDNVQRQYADQWNNLTKGETYTFSAYVKTYNVSNTNGKGAVISFYYKDKNGVYQSIDSKPISGTNDWQRLNVTFTLPNDASDTNVLTRVGVLGESGTAYFDSLQLETGSVSNRYNLMENGDLSGTISVPNKWGTTGTSGTDSLTTINDSDHPDNLNNTVYSVSGAYGASKRLCQSVNVSGDSGDIYSFGAWGKGYSVPSGTFQIQLAFVDGSSAQWVTLEFNKNYDKWQYISGKAIAKQKYSRIDIYYLYENNANTAYFDGAQLYKEDFDQSYQYDSKGNILSTAEIAKKDSTFQFQYNGNNDLEQSVAPKGGSFKYEYDSKHNVTRATTGENTSYNFGYDASGNPTTAKVGDGTDYLQSKATYTDSGNYIKSLTDSLGNTTTYNYDETKGLLNSTTDPKGNTTNNSYDGMDKLTSTSATADGQNVSNSYEYTNDAISKINHNGFSYNFAYDPLGNNTSVSVGNQNLTQNIYEPRTSVLLKSNYGNGQSVSTDYDNLDRKTADLVGGDNSVGVSYSGQVQNIGWQNPVSDYSEAGTEGQSLRLEAMKVQLNNALPGMKIKYQAHVQNVGWQDWVYDGQEAGTENQGLRMEAVKIELEGAPKGYIVRYQVHVEGIGWMDPVQDGETAGTVGKGLRIEAIRISVEKPRYTYKYDAAGNLAEENDNVNDVVNNYTYDLEDKLVKSSDSNGNEINYDYDKNNNLASLKDKVNGVNHETDYTYDKDNKLTASKYGSNEFDNSYDTLSRRTASTINTGTSKYNISYEYLPGAQTSNTGVTYDAHVENTGWQNPWVNDGQTAGTEGQGLRMEALKVKLTNPTSGMRIKYQAQVQNVGWQPWVYDGDEAGTEGQNLRMEAVKIQLEGAPSGYHIYYQAQVQNKGWTDVVSDGQTAGTEGQGLRLEALRIYIVKPDVDSKDSGKIGTVDNNGNKISYTYDGNGNIETVTEAGKTIKYTYNELEELKREDNGVLNKTEVYNYDAGGNLLSKTEYPYTTGDLPAAGSTINYGYGDANWKDKLTNYNGVNISYDAVGNPLNDGRYSYTWEQGKQLSAMSGNGQNISYKYNEDGARTEKTVNGVTTKYHLDGDKVTYETDGTNQIYYTYDSSDQLISMNLNGSDYYYIKDAAGIIIGLIDKSGTQVVSYTYDSFGKLIAIDGSLKDTVGQINPYRYKSYRYDSETGLYYLQSRYYNPEWGRFINADSITANQGELLSGNMFAYCENNPVNKADVDGNIGIIMDGDQTVWVIPAGIGGVSKASAYEAPKKPASRPRPVSRPSNSSGTRKVIHKVNSYTGDKIAAGAESGGDSVAAWRVSKSLAKKYVLFPPKTFPEAIRGRIGTLYASAKMSKFCGPLSAAATVLGMVDDGLNYKYGTQRILVDIAGLAIGAGVSVAIGAFLAPGLFAVGVGMLASFGISWGESAVKDALWKEEKD